MKPDWEILEELHVVPILVADDDLNDLGAGQGLGLGLALGLGMWALIGFVLGAAYSLGAA